MPTPYYIAWWNLENLFDEEGAVALGRRTDKVQRVIGKDIKGWTPSLRDKKISQLASVIAQMNAGAGPDLLGVSEVENRFVVDELVGKVNTLLPGPRSYQVVHADTSDARGIDVAFIYDDTKLEVPVPLADSVFFHVVMRRNATREIVQVNFGPRPAQLAHGRCSVTTGRHAAAGKKCRRDIAPSLARPSPSSIPVFWRCTAWTPRCWRWAISTTNRSTHRWSRTP